MNLETCLGCGCGIIKRHVWKAMSVAERETAREHGLRDKYANGQCRACWQREDRRARGIEAPVRATDVTAERKARLEDVAWMAETGECLAGAAKRLGITERSLERFLKLHDRGLLGALNANNPRDWNAVTTGTRVWDLYTSPARKEAAAKRKRQARAGVAA